MKIYIIEGWFGDVEWIEEIHLSKERAEERSNELWAERRSNVLPPDHFVQDLCKFAAVEYEVIA